MKKHLVSVSIFALAMACSTAAFADRTFATIIGEGYGHDFDYAYESASREAFDTCRSGWGESRESGTVLVSELQPDTGYWYVKLAIECMYED